MEVASRYRILVTVAQETHVIGVLELVQTERIRSELAIVISDRARVLNATMDEFFFPLAPEFRGNHRQSCRQCDQDERRCQE